MQASSRQKKRRSERKHKVFEKREKQENAKSNKPRKKQNAKKPVPVPSVVKKNEDINVTGSSSDTDSDSEEEQYGRRTIESNWQRYNKEDDKKLAQLAKLNINKEGSDSEESVEIDYTINHDGPLPDLNMLSKSPSEMFEWEKVCYDEESGDLHYNDQSDSLPATTDNQLDNELDTLLEGPQPVTTPSVLSFNPSHSTVSSAPLISNTDELDSMLDELLD